MPHMEIMKFCQKYWSYPLHGTAVTFPCSGGVSWCTLAYWEERRRVGRLFPVSSPVVEVFQVFNWENLLLGNTYSSYFFLDCNNSIFLKA
jgi:hypothetical protein